MADVQGYPRLQRGKSDLRRWISSSSSSLLSHRYQALLLVFWISCFLTVFFWQKSSLDGLWIFRQASSPGPPRPVPNLRHKVFNLTDFGAVGDGKKANTVAFEKAVAEIARHGGGQLNVPPGIWLTGPFNLTSHMTLFLAEGSVILGIEVRIGVVVDTLAVNFVYCVIDCSDYAVGSDTSSASLSSILLLFSSLLVDPFLSLSSHILHVRGHVHFGFIIIKSHTIVFIVVRVLIFTILCCCLLSLVLRSFGFCSCRC